MGHAALDALTVNADGIRALAPAVVLNASGPFQKQGYDLARACIEAGVHYVDLADAREFVTGIVELDKAAKAAGVLVVSGASSVPGISSAVVDHYRPAFSRLEAIEHGISPGNSFDPGEATTASILGAVGLPFKARINGRDATVHGWQGLSSHRFAGLGRRWIADCDIPDGALFPERYPDAATVRFKAGVEVGAFQLGIWLVSWLVRIGLLRRPGVLAAPLLAVKRRLGFLGSDRGGMFVSLRGKGHDGASHRVDWHMEAWTGQGPYLPTVPAVILARRLARGRLDTTGAMPCLGLVRLDEVLAEVADLDIRAYDDETPLYARVLGPKRKLLPEQVWALHDSPASIGRWQGTADVDRGHSALSRLVGALAGLPPEGRSVPLTVTLAPQDGAESWSRDFGGHIFRSRQFAAGLQIMERIGPAKLTFEPLVDPDTRSLSLRLSGVRVFGIPVPRALWPAIKTREWQEGGRYRFHVEARLPFAGRLVRYTGWLRKVG